MRGPSQKGKNGKASPEELAAALRANLQRRKAQARARAVPEQEQPAQNTQKNRDKDPEHHQGPEQKDEKNGCDTG